MKDYFGYQGKVCVVTGASSGMGEATARMLVDLGAKVYALDLNACQVVGIEKYIPTNLALKDSIDKAFTQIPNQFDCFFGIAGLSGAKTDYMTTFHVNYTSNVYISENYLKTRINNKGGIVIVSSTAGVAWKENLEECQKVLGLKSWEEIESRMQEIIPAATPAQLAYMYSKRLANAYACSLSLEMAKQGVRVNAVLPGSTDTGMKDEFAKLAGGLDNMIKYAGMAGRLATSEEMAGAIVFLNSDMASFISGEEIIIDYCDNAMKKLGIKPEMCGGPAIIDVQTLQQMMKHM